MKTKYWLEGAQGEHDFSILDGQHTAEEVESLLGLKTGSVIDYEWRHVDEVEPDHQD